VEILYELKVTPEEEEAAMKLKLPSNFYAYLRKPLCPGCAGCKNDSDTEVEVYISFITILALGMCIFCMLASEEGVFGPVKIQFSSGMCVLYLQWFFATCSVRISVFQSR
jgi:hypothetical protein